MFFSAVIFRCRPCLLPGFNYNIMIPLNAAIVNKNNTLNSPPVFVIFGKIDLTRHSGHQGLVHFCQGRCNVETQYFASLPTTTGTGNQ
jgi:hypothetical protein